MKTKTKLSVNINKIATLRNSRGGLKPDLLSAIDVISESGAHGITIHPREDERHITREDIFTISDYLREKHPHLELNIEGDMRPELVSDILKVKPTQATLVPVSPGELTSDHGFNFAEDSGKLIPLIMRYQLAGIRVSLFVNTEPNDMVLAASTRANRIEFYTGPYASYTGKEKEEELAKISQCIGIAKSKNLEINAGHDLDIENLPALLALGNISEVSIGHLLIVHALEVGLSKSVKDFLAVL